MTFFNVLAGWIFSLCLHEYAHARVAYMGGDTSVAEKGYLSFNPLRYTHPVLSILLPLVFLMMGGLGLPGGAVYIEHWRLRSKHWDSAVSAAGPLANLLAAFVIVAVLRFTPAAESRAGPDLAFLGLLEISAVVFNLIPVPGLDGFGILRPYLPEHVRQSADQAGGWAILVFFALLWYVPPVNNLFWTGVYAVASGLGVPLGLAYQGLDQFMFWQSE